MLWAYFCTVENFCSGPPAKIAIQVSNRVLDGRRSLTDDQVSRRCLTSAGCPQGLRSAAPVWPPTAPTALHWSHGQQTLQCSQAGLGENQVPGTEGRGTTPPGDHGSPLCPSRRPPEGQTPTEEPRADKGSHAARPGIWAQRPMFSKENTNSFFSLIYFLLGS